MQLQPQYVWKCLWKRISRPGRRHPEYEISTESPLRAGSLAARRDQFSLHSPDSAVLNIQEQQERTSQSAPPYIKMSAYYEINS